MVQHTVKRYALAMHCAGPSLSR